MATATRAPTSDAGAVGTWSGSAGTRYTLVDDYPDTGPTDVLTGSTDGCAIYFGFTAFAVPAGSTSISIQMQYYDRDNSAGANSARSLLFVGGTGYGSATHDPGALTAREDNWATNPRSGAAWTVDDVNGVGANGLTAFGIGSPDATPGVDYSCVRVQVTYTPAAGLDFTYTGTVIGEETLAGTRTIEKFFTGDVSAVGAFASTRSIEKFITGLIEGVATYEASRTIEKYVTGGVTGEATCAATRTIEKYVTGTVIGEATAAANRTIEKFVTGLVSGEYTLAGVMTYEPPGGLLDFTYTGDVSGELTLAAQRTVEKFFTGAVSAEYSLAAARTIEKVITGGITGEFYLSHVLSRPGWFTLVDKSGATAYSLAAKPVTSWSLAARPATSYSLVAKPTKTAQDGAITDGSTDGAYAEVKGPGGVWTDTGDGWTPVFTVDPMTWTGVNKPS